MKKGFSLIEVIVYLVVLSLVAVISIVGFNKNKKEKPVKIVVEDAANVYYEVNKKLYLEDMDENGNVFIPFGKLIENGLIDEKLIDDKYIENIKNSEDYKSLIKKPTVLSKETIKELYVRLYYNYDDKNKLFLDYSFPSNLIIFPKIDLINNNAIKTCYNSNEYRINLTLSDNNDIDSGTGVLKIINEDNNSSQSINFNEDIYINNTGNYKISYTYKIDGNEYVKFKNINTEKITISEGKPSLEKYNENIKVICPNESCNIKKELDNSNVSFTNNVFTPEFGTNNYIITDACGLYSKYNINVIDEINEEINASQLTERNELLEFKIFYIFDNGDILYGFRYNTNDYYEDYYQLKIINPKTLEIKEYEDFLLYKSNNKISVVKEDNIYKIYTSETICIETTTYYSSNPCISYNIKAKEFQYDLNNISINKSYSNNISAEGADSSGDCDYSYVSKDLINGFTIRNFEYIKQINNTKCGWSLQCCVGSSGLRTDVYKYFSPKFLSGYKNIKSLIDSYNENYIYVNNYSSNIETMTTEDKSKFSTNYFINKGYSYSNVLINNLDSYRSDGINLQGKIINNSDMNYSFLINEKCSSRRYCYNMINVDKSTNRKINISELNV